MIEQVNALTRSLDIMVLLRIFTPYFNFYVQTQENEENKRKLQLSGRASKNNSEILQISEKTDKILKNAANLKHGIYEELNDSSITNKSRIKIVRYAEKFSPLHLIERVT